MNSHKSLKKNAILNAIRVLMTIIFPLLTFPYATRVLGTVNMGKIQFSSSVIVFVSLFASLGISSYATREGAGIRDNKQKISEFASSIFSLNLFFTIVAYLGLFILLLLPTKLAEYKIVILILSIQVLFTTMGVDWVNSIYEDYLYITIRSVLSQIISLVLMLIFVKTKSDYYLYAIITVVANSGVNIINYFHVRKYCDIKLTYKTDYKKHIKPLLILFSNNLAQQVYINSDSVMLGFMTTDYNVGIYSVSVKIYTIIKRLLNAIITVAIPRMAYYNLNNEEKFYSLGKKIFKSSVLFLLPIMLLLFLLSDNIVVFISGKDYLEAGLSTKILSTGLLFAVFANLFCNGILIVKKEEKVVLRATLIAAIVNLSLNFVFIKYFKQNGAAITTVIAEFIVMFYTFVRSKKYLKIKRFGYEFITEIIGCIGIILTYICLTNIKLNNFVYIITISGIGIIIYISILLLLKNDTARSMYNQAVNRFLSKKK